MKKCFETTTLKKYSRIIFPIMAIVAMLLLYSRYQDSAIMTADVLQVLERLAIGFYIVFGLSIIVLGTGLYSYHKRASQKHDNSIQSILSNILMQKKSKKIFWVTFFVYGTIFSMASGTLVYQPDVTFSIHYGVDVPSAFISPCCDLPGFMPKILVYLTEHAGLQIIPINLLLQLIISYLVAFNMAIAIPTISLSRKTGGLCGTASVTGLFIACPTCAGTFLTLFFGTALGSGLTLFLVQLQTLFIALSIPVLLLTPIYMAKKFRNKTDHWSMKNIS